MKRDNKIYETEITVMGGIEKAEDGKYDIYVEFQGYDSFMDAKTASVWLRRLLLEHMHEMDLIRKVNVLQ